jgi:hypothetical protein
MGDFIIIIAPRRTARAPSSFISHVHIFVARYKNETKKETFELRHKKTRKMNNKYPPRSFRRRLRNDLSI